MHLRAGARPGGPHPTPRDVRDSCSSSFQSSLWSVPLPVPWEEELISISCVTILLLFLSLDTNKLELWRMAWKILHSTWHGSSATYFGPFLVGGLFDFSHLHRGSANVSVRHGYGRAIEGRRRAVQGRAGPDRTLKTRWHRVTVVRVRRCRRWRRGRGWHWKWQCGFGPTELPGRSWSRCARARNRGLGRARQARRRVCGPRREQRWSRVECVRWGAVGSKGFSPPRRPTCRQWQARLKRSRGS